MKSKTTLTLATIILAIASLLHLLRILNDWDLIIGSCSIPNWISIIGVIVPAILAFYVNQIRKGL